MFIPYKLPYDANTADVRSHIGLKCSTTTLYKILELQTWALDNKSS